MSGLDFGWRRAGPPIVMGILNATPDSFSDGGRCLHLESAVEHAFDMIDAGAEIIDIGAESTRPGFSPVDAEEELRRLIPIVERLSDSTDAILSVDTMKADVARAAVSAGAHMINDVNALRGDGMMDFIAESQVPAVIVHMNGTPADTHQRVMDDPVIPVIKGFLSERVDAAVSAGVRRESIVVDPGIGFGKTMEQNAEIIMNADKLASDSPLLIAASRKRVLAHMFPGMDPDEATATVSRIVAKKGADIVRVHDVAGTVNAIQNIRR